MFKSKISYLISSLDDRELSLFAKFLDSPYYNRKEEIRRMFDFLRKYHPDFSSENISREKVMKYMFPSLPFDEKKYKYYANLLLKLGEQFISLQETNSRPMIPEYHLLNAYEKRDVDKNFSFILKKTAREMEESELRDAEFHYKKYLLKQVSNKHFAKKKERKNSNHLQEMISAFDLYYMANKLKYSCHIINNQNILTGDARLDLIDGVVSFLEENDYSGHPAIHLYHNLYRLLTREESTYFEIIKGLLPEYASLFPKEELKEVNYIIINFCIRQLRVGKDTGYYLEELYRMYQFGIQAGFLLENDILSPWTFKNVVRLGLRLKKFKETESFISKNISHLRKEFRSDAYHFNMADLNYYLGKPNEALSFLHKVEFSDIYYVLDTKEMSIKIYYETGEYDALESLLESFQIYLRRNKTISDNVRESFMNFIRIMTKAVKGNTKNLESEIENTSPLTAKTWLLENVV